MQEIQTVIINIGVSGAGKTTWSSEYIKNNSYTIRINRDDLRKHFYGTLEGYYQHKNLNGREKYITEIEELLFLNNLQEGNNIIIDNTNLKPSYIEKWVKYVDAYNNIRGASTEVKFRIFPQNNVDLLKTRVSLRDKINSMKALEYIDKQVKSLETITKYIEDNHKTQIINE